VTAIAIFVKTPGLSPVKTRLAATLGTERAEALYRQCAAAVAEVACDAGKHVYWAIAEPADQAAEHWPDFAHIDQGAGGLGERMHRVLSTLVEHHGAGLLLGADAPQVEPAVLRRAAAWLQRNHPASVLGPASDGGFWTFGANHVPDLSCWTRVSYSHPDTLWQFRQSIGADIECLELPILTDLDTQEDTARVAAELAQLPQRLPRQNQLLDMLVG